MSDAANARCEVVVLTGFLGAGKTSLLRRWLADPGLAGSLVLINEFGEIGLDHALIADVKGDAVMLASGCMCCAVHGELIDVLAARLAERARGEVAFDRVIIETSGLADPTPIVAALTTHRAVAPWLGTLTVITVVDAAIGPETAVTHREAARQLALADRVIISKGDRVGAARRATVHEWARAHAPAADVVESSPAAPVEVAWLAPVTPTTAVAPRMFTAEAHHLHDVRSHALELTTPLRPGPLVMWLSLMTQLSGERLLRIKGVVSLVGDERPMALHTVQHLVFPLEPVAPHPSQPPGTSRVVFITRGMSASESQGLVDNFHQTLAPDQPVAPATAPATAV